MATGPPALPHPSQQMPHILHSIHAHVVCDVCHLDLSQVYKTVPGGFMQLHLTVEITELDYKTEYKPSDFITVCPNCHAMLHQYRPWLTKETVNEILY